MKGLLFAVSIWVTAAQCKLLPISYNGHAHYSHLTAPIASHFRVTKFPVVFWLDNTAYVTNRSTQLDALNAILLNQSTPMSTVLRNDPRCARTNRLRNVFIAATCRSLKQLLGGLENDCYYPTGLYLLIVTEECESEDDIGDVFEAVWQIRILNVVLIVPCNECTKLHRAYRYEPYETGNCGQVRLKLTDRYRNDRWQRLNDWFERSLPNFHHCPLKAVTFEFKPFVMVRQEAGDNRTRFVGLEVKIFQHIAAKLHFSIEYVSPPNNARWGVLRPHNSTGLMGMLQRNEADVGFGSVGRTIERNVYLRSSIPSIVTQLSMTIPPRVPYTPLEKLLLPFSASAWLLVGAGYGTILGLFVLLFRAERHPHREHIPGLVYTVWTILMGGPGREVRRNSTRLYIVSLVLNAFIVRNLYQSALFHHLKSTDVTAANLHTYQDINAAGLSYYMYPPTTKFYVDNPEVNSTYCVLATSNIRFISDETIDWDDVLYNISHHRLAGVFPLPLESVAYYVKHRGQQTGMVYVSERTGISYYVAFHFPRMSALQLPFDSLLHRLHDGGFILYWMSEYRNDPSSWMAYEQSGTPTPLKLSQLSGGFYLWAFGVLVAAVVFVTELVLSKVQRGHSSRVLYFADTPTAESEA
uniref:Ionotropic glutamate receptor L-glutamate and glycine-binding domain-containing protein n=1 Tax=Anopheles epiroticus TaxID=199890 RepID=A0A182P503_9DIPT